MGGRTIKYPKRRKFVSKIEKPEESDKELSNEEHEERLRKLKELDLLK